MMNHPDTFMIVRCGTEGCDNPVYCMWHPHFNPTPFYLCVNCFEFLAKIHEYEDLDPRDPNLREVKIIPYEEEENEESTEDTESTEWYTFS